MTVRTNVGESLTVLELNQTELLRRQNEQGLDIVALQSLGEQQQALLERDGYRLKQLIAEVERLSADLDIALADLDAIQAGP